MKSNYIIKETKTFNFPVATIEIKYYGLVHSKVKSSFDVKAVDPFKSLVSCMNRVNKLKVLPRHSNYTVEYEIIDLSDLL